MYHFVDCSAGLLVCWVLSSMLAVFRACGVGCLLDGGLDDEVWMDLFSSSADSHLDFM